MPDTWFSTGEMFIRAVQSHANPLWDALFILGTFLGNETAYLLIIPLFYWCVDRALGRWIAYGLLLSAYVNHALKYVWHTPRPPQSLWRNVSGLESPGFPSGHAQTSTVIWGTMAARTRALWSWLLAIVLVTVISFSRIYNGVHYPHDVVGGLLIGVGLLLLFLWAGPAVASRTRAWSPTQVAAILAAVAVPLLLLHPEQNGRWPAPGAMTVLATLWGMGVGFRVEQARVRFDPSGPLWQRALRYLVGIILVGVVYVGPKLLVPSDLPPLLALAARAVRYGLVGLMAAWWAPVVFVRVRLAAGATA